MAMKYMNKDDKVTPGPSDYKFDPINSLKRGAHDKEIGNSENAAM